MNILVITASRYGSTAQGGEWIAERLRLSGWQAMTAEASHMPSPERHDCIVLGSGIYAHSVLPELEAYITHHLSSLRALKVALFGVCMSPKPIFVRGRSHGGLAHLEGLFEKLGSAVVHADMLGGQLAFAGLAPQDQRSMEAFYEMLGLDADEIERRKEPRTLMKKESYWEFAHDLLVKLKKCRQ